MDTSALTKLLIAEPETPEWRAWLAAQRNQGDYAATSDLGRVELMRVVRREVSDLRERYKQATADLFDQSILFRGDNPQFDTP